jgi:mRNA interferase RelE/StbE
MPFKLFFKEDAKKEWDKLDMTIRSLFVKKLKERIVHPRIESSRLSGMKDCYKIKLRQVGYRLVYQVRDNELVVSVVAVGKREKNQVYKIAIKRLYQKSKR